MESVRTVLVGGEKWVLNDYIMFFHDTAENFKQCVSAEVLSQLEKKGNRHRITLEECAGYLQFAYGGGTEGCGHSTKETQFSQST